MHVTHLIFQALVLFGVANAGLNEFDQAEGAYRKAIELSSDNPLAWQVLLLSQ